MECRHIRLRIFFGKNMDALDVIQFSHRAATEIVIETVLPFSTNGGISSFTLPWCNAASPTASRIAAAIDAGVAIAGRKAKVDAKSELAFRPPRSSAAKVRADVALKSLFREGARMAQETGVLSTEDNRAAGRAGSPFDPVKEAGIASPTIS
jgi:hypothetical protein